VAALKLNELIPQEGTNKKAFRKGRGHATGNGKTSGRGHKGQNSRSGGGTRPGFEGGQMPLYRVVPKRGFTNSRFKKVFAEIDLNDLNRFDDETVVTAEVLLKTGVVSKLKDGIVVLGNGSVDKNLTVKASRFTKTAREKIEAAGGKVEVI
jgi:large subunit ribosomal protein L15